MPKCQYIDCNKEIPAIRDSGTKRSIKELSRAKFCNPSHSALHRYYEMQSKMPGPKPCIGCGKTIPYERPSGEKKHPSEYAKSQYCRNSCSVANRKKPGPKERIIYKQTIGDSWLYGAL